MKRMLAIVSTYGTVHGNIRRHRRDNEARKTRTIKSKFDEVL